MKKSSITAPSLQVIAPQEAGSPAAEQARRLRELSELMDRPNAFTAGSLVKWKPGLKNRRRPEYNERAVVRAALSAPIFDGSESGCDSGTPIFREPLTLVLGVLVEEGDFLEYHVDGRRFEPAKD